MLNLKAFTGQFRHRRRHQHFLWLAALASKKRTKPVICAKTTNLDS